MSKGILLLPGDGIGPEIFEQLDSLFRELLPRAILEVEKADFGGYAIERHGTPLPEETLAKAQRAKVVLLGAVGGPEYDDRPLAERPEKGLLKLRSELGVYANLRPAMIHDKLLGASSLKEEKVKGMNLMIVRELIGGIYFGEPRGEEGDGDDRAAYNTMRYSVHEIRRVAKLAFETAQKREKKELCSVDKANVLEVSGLWRETIASMASDYPDVKLHHMYVDNAAMQMVINPKQFDVIVTGNIFGDILSDLAGALAGSIGMLPSASWGDETSIYEPVHGSAPDIAGADKANPCAAFMSLGMALDYSLGRYVFGGHIAGAISDVLKDGRRTADIAEEGEAVVGCREMGEAIIARTMERIKGTTIVYSIAKEVGLAKEGMVPIDPKIAIGLLFRHPHALAEGPESDKNLHQTITEKAFEACGKSKGDEVFVSFSTQEALLLAKIMRYNANELVNKSIERVLQSAKNDILSVGMTLEEARKNLEGSVRDSVQKPYEEMAKSFESASQSEFGLTICFDKSEVVALDQKVRKESGKSKKVTFSDDEIVAILRHDKRARSTFDNFLGNIQSMQVHAGR